MTESRGTARAPGGVWPGHERLLRLAKAGDADPKTTIEVLRGLGAPPVPGSTETAALFDLLTELATFDLGVARTVEPHLDAAAILQQAGRTWEQGRAWAVYASASDVHWAPLGSSLRDVSLHGTKRWCSLAGYVDSALVTARGQGGEWLFELQLSQPRVHVREGGAPVFGLSSIPSGPVVLDGAVATRIGDAPGWYASRPGFAWGGICVAAVWFGGALALFRTLREAALNREPDQLALAWLGEADRLVHGMRAQLADAATRIDAGTADWALAQRVRGNVAAGSSRMIALVGESLGPGPLAFDPTHARRVADLTLYLRQHHGSRDDAARGRDLIAASRGGDR